MLWGEYALGKNLLWGGKLIYSGDLLLCYLEYALGRRRKWQKRREFSKFSEKLEGFRVILQWRKSDFNGNRKNFLVQEKICDFLIEN